VAFAGVVGDPMATAEPTASTSNDTAAALSLDTISSRHLVCELCSA
jgi:hypothetical protein